MDTHKVLNIAKRLLTKSVALGATLFAFCTSAYGGTADTALFWRPVSYGSLSMLTPWNVVLNSSYDILQLDGQDRRIFKLPYGAGLKNVLRNITAPGAAISDYGWWNVISREVLPLNVEPSKAQWLPNWQLHLIGGGMTWRAMLEWFEYHKTPLPEVGAGLTLLTYHMINEAVENDTHEGYNVDPIVDILLFDIAGVLLFSNDDVARFFARDLRMADWSMQAALSVNDGRLVNNGQYFSVRWNPGFMGQTSLFYLFGMSNIAGISVPLGNGDEISFGAGARGKNLYDIDRRRWIKSLVLVWAGGIYWDREGSLMASLQMSGQQDQTVTANIYPGVVDVEPFGLGLFASWGNTGGWSAGITLRATPGLGLSW